MPMDKELHIVGFRIGRETFGLPISSVREIIRVPEITVVPNAPEDIAGVTNLRGKIIPVIDLRKKFGVSDLEPHRQNRIVVVELEGRLVGLIVTSASAVLRIPASEMEAPGNVFPNGEYDYVRGVGKLNGRLVILLDLDKLVSRGEFRTVEEESLEVIAAGTKFLHS
jgi:purine-binding chemotaxis protein CheW